jgi:hypothetical protein
MSKPMPSFKACWRRAPTVRFIAREITDTRVLAFECRLSSRWSSFDHGRIFPLLRQFVFLADFLFVAIVTSKQGIVLIMETIRSRYNMTRCWSLGVGHSSFESWGNSSHPDARLKFGNGYFECDGFSTVVLPCISYLKISL